MNEYPDALLAACQLVWGEGFLAPGGAGNVARMLRELDVREKVVVDVGCGLGGPCCVLVEDFGARVVGLDLEASLIERARARAAAKGLAERARFELVDGGPLPFPDACIDVVLSAGAYTQTGDKLAAFRDCLRVLKPGGAIRLYDWTRLPGELSRDMRTWIELEGLTYALETQQRYRELLEEAGFVDVCVEDASDWYRPRVAEEYAALRGRLFPQLLDAMGRERAEHFVENWRAALVVCERGEMRQAYSRGRKPAS